MSVALTGTVTVPETVLPEAGEAILVTGAIVSVGGGAPAASSAR